MATHQFQESTISTVKALADKSVESFLNELNKKEEQTGGNFPDNKTRELLDDFVCAAILDGTAEGKNFDQAVDHLASTIGSHSTEPLRSGAADAIANILLQSSIDELSKIATNPENTSLGNDKDIIRDAVIGWSRSSRSSWDGIELEAPEGVTNSVRFTLR